MEEKKMIPVEDANKMIDIIRREAEHEKQVKLNQIASALKADYIDIMSVKDEEMTIEMGEVIRCQMIEMFKTLKKMGVDVESRI